MKITLLLSFLLLAGCLGLAAEEKLLLDIETKDDIRHFGYWKCDPATISTEKSLLGTASLKAVPGTYINLDSRTGVTGDWSAYDELHVDFHNTTGKSIPLSILVGDQDWKDHGMNYWNRHNAGHIIPPGDFTFKMPVKGLWRGEAGSRNNQLKYAIVPSKIIRIDFGLGKKADADKGFIYMDNIRLVSTTLPEYIKAFDFGPEEQNVESGYIPITWNTIYSQDKGYGLKEASSDKNRARDDTFPPGSLYRDWLNMSEVWKDLEFMVDIPNGTYQVTTCFSDCGYWGGEAIRHTERSISAEGKEVWSENLGDKGNYWKPNYLFENIEPLVGQDLWSLYMETIFAPQQFTVTVTDGQMNLSWHADKSFSTKLNSLIIYPIDKPEGKAFVEQVWAAQKEAFQIAAVEEKPGAGGTLEAIPADKKANGYLFFLTDFQKDTYQTTIPSPQQFKNSKAISACPGEREPVTFAIRPLKNLGKAEVIVSDFTGPAGTIDSVHFEKRVVRHLTSRGFSKIGYTITPQLIKKFTQVELPADITREFLVWAKIPENAAAGSYTGTITLKGNGFEEQLQVNLTVHPFTLDNSEFVFGFYGTIQNVEHAKLLRSLGFNSFSGGYKMDLKGYNADGTPEIDYTRMDEYMAMLREAGYTQEGWGYGGYQITHIGYTKDEAFFSKWEKETGLSYQELLNKTFAAVETHAQANNWLPGVYGMIDEPRNRDFARRSAEQIRMVSKAANWLKTGGSYSVTFKNGRDKDDYHQWMFDAVEASALNNHDQSVLDEANKTGKEIYIYNQGRTRFTFGAYQWAEYQKGIKGRHQWHLHIVHGFQFFDLDAREPDSATMLYYGEQEAIPTLNLLRCAEGADDFYYMQTLHNQIQKTGDSTAQPLLDKIVNGIGVNQRSQPDWLDNDAFRQECAAAITTLLSKDTVIAAAPEAQTAAASETAKAQEDMSMGDDIAAPKPVTEKRKGCGPINASLLLAAATLIALRKRSF